jgi:hypothetical protein
LEAQLKHYYDAAKTYPKVRLHPYRAGGDSPTGYLDFVKNADQISTALEDFRPFSDRSAVQGFYDFLQWLNGSESYLQSSDCAFRPPAPHQDTNSHSNLSAVGRIFIMFRDLQLNCSALHTDWLCKQLMDHLSAIDPDMSAAEGVVGFTLNPALHLDLAKGIWHPSGEFEAAPDSPGFGRQLMLTFYVYGNDENHVFDNLDRVFRNIWSACRSLSQEVHEAISAGGGVLKTPTSPAPGERPHAP